MSTLSSHCTRLPSATNLHLCHRSRFLSQHFHFPLLLSAHDYQKLTPLRISLQNPPKSSSYLGSRTLRIRSSMDSATSTQPKPFSVLFVCLGNICRSPAAEGVFRDIVKKRGLDSEFEIDSAGTINYHEGNLADPRMRSAAKRRSIEITSLSRPIRPSDFRDFDLILAMDKQNREDILEAFNRWKFREPLPEDAHKKVKLMCSYCKKHSETEVPDPYYGGPQGFEKFDDNDMPNSLLSCARDQTMKQFSENDWSIQITSTQVLDMLEDACESLLDSILAEKKTS